jgi:hypothetical protein
MRSVAIRLYVGVIMGALAGPGLGRQPLAAQATGSEATAVPDSARTALGRRLLERMRAADAVLSGMQASVESQRRTNPNIPDIFWTTFTARAKQGVPALVERLVPIYASRFSSAELEQMIAFYATPAGQHFAAESAPISLALMKAGAEWGAELGADVAKELVAQGIQLQ